MNFDQESKQFSLSDQELATLKQNLNPKENALSIFSEIATSLEHRNALQNEFDRMIAEAQTLASQCIRTLAAPIQMAHIHHTIADSLISRIVVGWSPDNLECLSVLGRSGDLKILTQSSPDEFKFLFKKILAVDATLKNYSLNLKLSRNTLIIFLAILDYFRAKHFESLLTHSVPLRSFSNSDLLHQIVKSTHEDFRWPLHFIEKLLSFPILELASPKIIFQALEELSALQLIVKNEGDISEKSIITYMLSDAGASISQNIMQSISKLALHISSANEQGETVTETLFFIRDPLTLWFFELSDQAGWITSLSTDHFEKLLEKIFLPDLYAPKEKSEVKLEPLPQPKFCSACGKQLLPGAQFCGGCGRKNI